MAMNFTASKQYVNPPQRGIFPLDHDAECKKPMEVGHISTSINEEFLLAKLSQTLPMI
jgi:hypothetical protein